MGRGRENSAFIPLFPGGVVPPQLQAGTQSGCGHAPLSVPRGAGRATAVMEGQPVTVWTFQHRPSLRPSPGVRELVQLASPGWQHLVTQWFPPAPLRSCPCETSAASASIQPPTPPGAKRWGLSALSPAPPSVVARGRRGSGVRAGRLPDPSLFLLPAPSAPFSPTALCKAGARESPRTHLCRKR